MGMELHTIRRQPYVYKKTMCPPLHVAKYISFIYIELANEYGLDV